MYLSVIQVQALENYQLKLTFENHENRIFDVKPYLNTGIFTELKNAELFKSVRICFDTIEWSNGADLDPEVLYADSIPA